MKKQRRTLIRILGRVIILAAGYLVCSADYSIDWSTIDGGGGETFERVE